MSNLVSLEGKGAIGPDGKPVVNLIIEINCDTTIDMAGESVFQSPIIKERMDSLYGTISRLQQQQMQSNVNEKNILFEIGRLKSDLFLKTNECFELRNAVKSLMAANDRLKKELASRSQSN
jgi:hypothetical protein